MELIAEAKDLMGAERADRYTYRNLIVWDRAQGIALSVISIVQRLPQTWANAILARQIIASATSVGANIAEGHGRFSPGAHRNHLSIAKGSATETDSWLDLLRRMGLLSVEEERALHQGCIEIIAMLTSKIHDLERLEQAKSGRVVEETSEYQLADSVHAPYAPFVESDYISV